MSVVSNLDDFDRNTKATQLEHAKKLRELIDSTPHIRFSDIVEIVENMTATDVISDLLVDSYVRGLARAQNEAQEVLGSLYDEMVNETAGGGFSEWQESMLNYYPEFLAIDVVQEWVDGYWHIHNKFSKTTEFLNSFKTIGRTNRVQQGREFQVGIEKGKLNGWDIWPKWTPPPGSKHEDPADADVESDRVIEELFKNSYMYQEIKKNYHTIISKGGFSITKTTLQTLYDVILQLRTTFMSVRLTLGSFSAGGSLFLFKGSSNAATVGRLWQADKAIELAVFKNPAQPGDVQAVFDRIASIRDIDRVISEFSSTRTMKISEWEQIANARVSAAEDALTISRTKVSNIEKDFQNINTEVSDALDVKYPTDSVFKNYINLEDANDDYFRAVGEQDKDLALFKEIREATDVDDVKQLRELEKDYNDVVKLTEKAEQRWNLAKRYEDLVREQKTAFDEMVTNENTLVEAKNLFESRGEATVLLEARERELISKMYIADENGLSFSEATEQAWNDAMIPIDVLREELRAQRMELNIILRRGNISAAESKVAEIENSEIELQQLKSSTKASTGIDANMGWRRSFLNQFEESLAKARLNTRTNIKRVDVIDFEDAALNEAEGLAEAEGGIIEEFIDLEGAALIENTVTFAGVEGAILDIAAAEFVLGFGASLMTNFVNIIFIYYSIESLEISLEMSEKQTAATLAFNNPNLQSMITWWAQDSAFKHAKNIARDALKTEEFKSAFTALADRAYLTKQENEVKQHDKIFNELQEIKAHMVGPGLFEDNTHKYDEIKDAWNKLSYSDPRYSHCAGGINTVMSMYLRAKDQNSIEAIYQFYVILPRHQMSYYDLEPYYRITTQFHHYVDEQSINDLVELIDSIVTRPGQGLLAVPNSVQFEQAFPIPLDQVQELIVAVDDVDRLDAGGNSKALVEISQDEARQELSKAVVLNAGSALKTPSEIAEGQGSSNNPYAIDELRQVGRESWDGFYHTFAYYDGNLFLTAFSIICNGHTSHFVMDMSEGIESTADAIANRETVGDTLLIAGLIGTTAVTLYATPLAAPGYAMLAANGVYFKFKPTVDRAIEAGVGSIPEVIDISLDIGKGIGKATNAIAPVAGIIGVMLAGGYVLDKYSQIGSSKSKINHKSRINQKKTKQQSGGRPKKRVKR